MLLWHIYAMKRLILPLIVFISLLSLFAVPAAAQGQEIILKSVSVVNQFPDGIRFRAEAEATAPAQIKEIKLEMKVKGSNRGSYTYLDFPPAVSVAGEYLLKTTGAQYKPPGTLIEGRRLTAVAPAVADGVAHAAYETGTARRRRRQDLSVFP